MCAWELFVNLYIYIVDSFYILQIAEENEAHNYNAQWLSIAHVVCCIVLYMIHATFNLYKLFWCSFGPQCTQNDKRSDGSSKVIMSNWWDEAWVASKCMHFDTSAAQPLYFTLFNFPNSLTRPLISSLTDSILLASWISFEAKIADEAKKFLWLITIFSKIILLKVNSPSGFLFHKAKLLSELCDWSWLPSTLCACWP